MLKEKYLLKRKNIYVVNLYLDEEIYRSVVFLMLMRLLLSREFET